MIWNGTDPLQPDHEVAYRGWPTMEDILAEQSKRVRAWLTKPRRLRDLIHLQQEPEK